MKIYNVYMPYGNTLELYAWSTSKKRVKEFNYARESMKLVVKPIDIDDSELIDVQNEYDSLEISPMSYNCNNGEKALEILTTEWEMNEVEVYIDNDLAHMDCVDISYKIYSKKVIKALDTLGYTYHHLKDTLGKSEISGELCDIDYDYIALLSNLISNGGVINIEGD